MDRRGELAGLEGQIAQLMTREKLTEDEVKQLCEKVRSRGGLCWSVTLFALLVGGG